ncbi:hypothetical protein GCM10023231_24390 [Olivibacter ginsenosidimutans]|uniref:Cytochrome c domain-containing protein n=2 Tax=Olivibacter ginsenosidimutans TaxID=1176537 RepID=A0ABP9BGG1_9SPHI
MKQIHHDDQGVADIKGVLRYVKILAVLCVLLLIILPILLHFKIGNTEAKEPKEDIKTGSLTAIAAGFEIPPFDDTEEGKMAEYGHKLITETYALIGPGTQKAITGNKLACSSCHLDGGTKSFAAPYIGLSGVFPIYIGREDKIESLEERINGCFERSMNGKAIDVNSKEMRAIMSYIKHLSKDAPVGTRLKGQGFVDFKAPDRAADIKKGAIIYKNTCATCHGPDGGGLKGTKGNREGGYVYPPLWGEDAYNDGAGMARLLTAARFIKGNMPLGVTHDAPLLSDEDAFDVAAYINSHERPVKANRELDYPNLAKKPVDCPYPPYQDEISQEQHQLGPFTFKK